MNDEQKFDLEQELLSTDWLVEKVRANDVYAQNLYAALCNNQFRKNEVWPILTDDNWSCSWRYAGGIIADIIGSGDYLDWYCSGIIDDDNSNWVYMAKNGEGGYVNEGVVTEEITEDLKKIGWFVVSDKEN